MILLPLKKGVYPKLIEFSSLALGTLFLLPSAGELFEKDSHVAFHLLISRHTSAFHLSSLGHAISLLDFKQCFSDAEQLHSAKNNKTFFQCLCNNLHLEILERYCDFFELVQWIIQIISYIL